MKPPMPVSRWLLVAGAAIVLLGLGSREGWPQGVGGAGTTQLEPDGLIAPNLGAAAHPRRVSVLIHFERIGPRLRAQAAGARRQKVRTFVRKLRSHVHHEYKILPHVINVREIPENELEALRAMPGVVKVERDEIVTAHLAQSTPLIGGLQSQLLAAGLAADGSGVRVCIIDTGIDSDHLMYAGRVDAAAGFDFVNNDSNPEDDEGHGSHVAGIAVGRTGLTVDFGCPGPVPFQGIASAATLIGVKVLGSDGMGFLSDVVAGIDHCADPALPGGPAHVINLSLGSGDFTGACDSNSLALAANNAVDAGVVVVASAGNGGTDNSMGTPACASKVIAVGAVYDQAFPNCEDPSTTSFSWCLNSSCSQFCTDDPVLEDARACFSNQSDQLDVTAPGCGIYSASRAAGGRSITSKCGTSQASPHAAGLAALLLDADPSLTPDAVRQHIRNGSIDLGSPGFDRAYGFGVIDIINSLQLATTPCSTDVECDDGFVCNGEETCISGSCQLGTPVDCDDAVACTVDSCIEPSGSCDRVPDDAACADGLFCNGAETCDAGVGCLAGSDPCPGEPCNESAASCGLIGEGFILSKNADFSTDDRIFSESDTLHMLVFSDVVDFNNISKKQWELKAGDRVKGQLTNHFDGTYTAVYDLSNLPNSATDWRWKGKIEDKSKQRLQATTTTTVLPAPACNVDADCDDGLFCNGAEACDPVSGCQAGAPVDCSDAVGCTADSCDETTDSCDHLLDDAQCDDGLACNGAESCDASVGCQAGTSLVCDDGNSCTTDTCNDASGCVSVPIDCSDGVFCNGLETCDPVAGCQAVAAVDCDDGLGCTVDSCNEASASCDNVPGDAACDDGLFCNGAETCDATADCQAGSDPCSGQSCDEGTDQCVGVSEVVTITMAEWKRGKLELKVRATSSEQPGAVLTVIGFGQMRFRDGKNHYEFKTKPVANPGTVTVTSSLGGSDTATVRSR